MSDPNFPQYPGTPGGAPQYGQQPGQPGQQQGQSPYAPPGQYPGGYPMGSGLPPEPPASGGTAITAGVFALVGAVLHVVFLIIQLSQLDRVLSDGVTTFQMIMNAVLPLILLPGGILLLMRRTVGKNIVTGASALATLYFLGIGIYVIGLASDTGAPDVVVGGATAGLFILLIGPVTTFILMMVPLTGKWVSQGQRPPAGRNVWPGQPS